MSAPPAILTEGLSKRFQRSRGWLRRPGAVVPAVDGMDLVLPRGAILGVMGPNGAGKTTFLKLLATLLLPDSGRLEVDGIDCVASAGSVRSRIGLVTGDERSFYWRLSGRQNLAFFGALQGIGGAALERRILDLSSALALEDMLDAPVDTFSTGMRQRLSVARGLLHEPSLLLLDEPTRSLDPEAAEAFRVLLLRLVREGGHTVVLVTHAREEARAVCTHLGVMRAGKFALESVS
ncbi:MAG: ABC transporter ATP-binding protein [Deltaproteobacteria bacterium]|nr:ABC transporter ATP-binding protein [Deltaproteobacteria bacterium]